MKNTLTLAALATLLMSVPLMADNAPGFENFTLSRNDFKSNPSGAISDFSSRTHTDADAALANFSSRKPIGFALRIR